MEALVCAGRSREELSREFEPSAQSISNWVAQTDRDEGKRKDSVTSAEREELRRLRKENRQLMLKRENLSKAAAGSLRRRCRIRRDLRVHESASGHLSGSGDETPAECLRQRILCMEGPSVVEAGGRGHRADGEDLRRPSALRGRLWLTDAPRLANDYDTYVGKKCVAWLMRAAGIKGPAPVKFVTTTTADPDLDRAFDKVNRQFTADGPDRLCVPDITYVPTWSGFLCLAIVLDAFSRRIVGWAMAESFFATLEREVTDRQTFKSQTEATMAIFRWLEGWYNPHRRHSSLGYLSRINYENKMLSNNAAASSH